MNPSSRYVVGRGRGQRHGAKAGGSDLVTFRSASLDRQKTFECSASVPIPHARDHTVCLVALFLCGIFSLSIDIRFLSQPPFE
jgi:hypothetical protein